MAGETVGGPTESREHEENNKKRPLAIDNKRWNVVL